MKIIVNYDFQYSLSPLFLRILSLNLASSLSAALDGLSDMVYGKAGFSRILFHCMYAMTPDPCSPPLLEVRDLTVAFSPRLPEAKDTIAVDSVTFTLGLGQTVCLVGESGCGKTLTALAIMGLLPPGAKILSGAIVFNGRNLVHLPEKELRRIRGQAISMIFQEPMTALNPVARIGAQVAEPLMLHQKISKREAWEKAADLLRQVGIPDPEMRVRDFPHQMSGGMRQRAMIAMALACRPQLIIADEPTTALDVTIQRQILALMASFGGRYGTGILLITHDLGVVAEMGDIVLIMYAGAVVERARAADLFANPLHPYTRGLMASRPSLARDGSPPDPHHRLEPIPGIVPALTDLPPGCAFFDRCPRAMPECALDRPPRVAAAPDHEVRCFLYAPPAKVAPDE